jgi:O-acetyl-ADP-ribose deacetylase (regulator of RNase III)
MTPIAFVRGDATRPTTGGPMIITHLCNDMGRWGKGFVLAVSSRWLEPEKAYRQWSADANSFKLGAVQFVQVEEEIWVANMIGQHGVRHAGHESPIRYAAVEECLTRLAVKAKEFGASVRMPRIGCGLAGGKWGAVQPLIVKSLCEREIVVVVYDL